MNLRTLIPLTAVVTAMLWLINTNAALTGFLEGLDETRPMIVDKGAREVRILAELRPSAFVGGWFTSTPGHHAVAWKQGKKAGESLLVAYVSDADLHDALISIGATPGNNLSQAVWDDRYDKSSKAPDTRVEGSPLEVTVWWPGLKSPLPLASLFNDPGGRGIDLRFGGQKSLIPVWRSGCIICLQSCPGAKISNRSYTMRDYADGKATFTLNNESVPAEKRMAVVIVRVKEK